MVVVVVLAYLFTGRVFSFLLRQGVYTKCRGGRETKHFTRWRPSGEMECLTVHRHDSEKRQDGKVIHLTPVWRREDGHGTRVCACAGAGFRENGTPPQIVHNHTRNFHLLLSTKKKKSRWKWSDNKQQQVFDLFHLTSSSSFFSPSANGRVVATTKRRRRSRIIKITRNAKPWRNL